MKNIVLGIDIGGTNTVIGAVDARGNVLGTTSLSTREPETFEKYIDSIHTKAGELLERLEITVDDIEGIGAGAPNGNYYDGTIENAANLRWEGTLPLAAGLAEAFGVPAACTNDANAAAIGEMTYGAARGMRNFIMITLGTGVGSGIVANGEVLYGADGFAGELGHVIVKRRNGRQCNCGRSGCLECYCSATGVARTARELLDMKDTPSLLRDMDPDAITSKDVYDAAVKGDKLALEVFEYTGTILGEALADFTAFLAPEAFVIFGGLAKAGHLLFDPIKKALEDNVLFLWKNKVRVIPSELPDAEAAILGASALGWIAPNKK